MTTDEKQQVAAILVRECGCRRAFADCQDKFYCSIKNSRRCKSDDCYFRYKDTCPDDCCFNNHKSIYCDGVKCKKIKKLMEEMQ